MGELWGPGSAEPGGMEEEEGCPLLPGAAVCVFSGDVFYVNPIDTQFLF